MAAFAKSWRRLGAQANENPACVDQGEVSGALTAAGGLSESAPRHQCIAERMVSFLGRQLRVV
jgi:hypothetical protein